MTAGALLRTFDGMLPMQLGPAREVQVFGIACLIGAALGAAYQLIRAARVIVPHFKWAVFLEDMLFGLFFGGCFFLLFTGFEQKLRGFILFGMILSAFTVHFAVGEPLIRLLRAADNVIKGKILAPVLGFIAKRAKRVYGRFVQKYKNFKKFCKKDENRLKEGGALVYNNKVNKLLKG